MKANTTTAQTDLTAPTPTTTHPAYEELSRDDVSVVADWFGGNHTGVIRKCHLEQNPVFDNPDGDRVEEMEDQIENWVDDLKNATEDALTDEKFREWLDVQSKFHDYSYRNQILIQMQYPGATKVAGSKTWQNEFNRHPVSGAKAIWIRCPLTTTGKKCPDCGCTAEYDPGEQRKRSDQSAAENHSVCDYDTAPENWSEGQIVYGYTDGWVFDVEQTTGEPMPNAPSMSVSGDGGEEAYQTLKDVADKLGVTVEEKTDSLSLPGAVGTSDGDGTVEILVRGNKADQAQTLAHELAHELLHTRSDRLGDIEKSQREVEAEAVGYVVARHFGFDADNCSFYLGRWADDSPEVLEDRLDRISNTSKKILDKV